MASWVEVDFGFAGDETGNFGPRHESGSALYQVDTLAVISPEGEVIENPEVKSTSCGENLCIAAGCHVSFFSDDGSNYTGTLAFESTIDAIAWCPGGDFLVLGERNGSLHLLNAETQASLFATTLVKNPNMTEPTFTHISCSIDESTHLCELLILVPTTLYTMSSLDLEGFRTGVKTQDMLLLKDVKRRMTICTTDLTEEHSEGAICCMHLGSHDNAIITAGIGKSVLTVWSMRNGVLTPIRRCRYYRHAKGIRKIASIKRDRCLLTLDTEDNMVLWHAPTLTIQRLWTEHAVLDFCLLDATVENTGSFNEKFVVRMNSKDGKGTSLSVRNIWTMEPEYTLELAKFTHLVQGPPNQEFISFVEGLVDENSSIDLIASLRLRTLSELQPDTRFNRLLHKKQFEQAEILAKKFSLDVELVFKVKATGILDQLSPWIVEKYPTEEVEKLVEDYRECLNSIHNVGTNMNPFVKVQGVIEMEVAPQVMRQLICKVICLQEEMGRVEEVHRIRRKMILADETATTLAYVKRSSKIAFDVGDTIILGGFRVDNGIITIHDNSRITRSADITIPPEIKEEGERLYVSPLTPFLPVVEALHGNSGDKTSISGRVVSDEAMLVKCCTQAMAPRMETCRELLVYAKKRLSDDQKPNGHGTQNGGGGAQYAETSLNHDELVTRVLEVLHRLDTFHAAFGPKHFTPTSWARFLDVDMFEEIKQQFAVGSVSCAAAIWRRHSCEFDEILGQGNLQVLLESIPESIPSQRLTPWLSQYLLPYIIRKQSSCLEMVASWLEQRAQNLEILEASDWPANGLSMAELFENCMSSGESSIQSSLITPAEVPTPATCVALASLPDSNKQDEEEPNAFCRLHTLVLELKDLLSLHQKYRCPLTLAEYRKQTTESLSYRMLDRVPAVDLVASAIAKVVMPYMKEHNLKVDRMLYQYVVDLGERLGHSNMNILEEVPWEEKAIVVIGCISEMEYKIKAVLRAVEKAKVPWSKGMTALVEEALQLDHPLVSDLKEQKRLVEFRKILFKYSIPHHHVLKDNVAIKLINFILRQDQSTTLEDAVAVAAHFNCLTEYIVYERQMKYLISKNRALEASDFIKTLSPEHAIRIGNCVHFLAKEVLNRTVIFQLEADKLSKLSHTHIACQVIAHVLTLENLESDLREKFEMELDILQNIHSLQLEFDEFVTYDDYLCATRKKLFEKMAVLYLSTKPDEKLNKQPPKNLCECVRDRKTRKISTWNGSRMYRFADLIKIPRYEFKGQLALYAADNGQVKKAIDTAREIYAEFPGEYSASVINKVAMRFCHLLATGRFWESCNDVPDIASVILEFAALPVFHCNQDLLQKYAHFYGACKIAFSVAQQCETGDYERSLKKSGTSKDPYEEWTFDNYFEEDGLVMDSSIALPLAYQYVLSSTSPGYLDTNPSDASVVKELEDEDLSQAVDQLSNGAISMVTHLRENNQLWLSLSFSVDGLYMVLLKLRESPAASKQGVQEVEEQAVARAAMFKKITSHGLRSVNAVKDEITQKLFKQRNFDSRLGLAFMMDSPTTDAANKLMTNMMKEATPHFKQISRIALIGEIFATVNADLKIQNFYCEIRKKSTWAHELKRIGVILKDDTVLNTVHGAMSLLPMMTEQKSVGISLLTSYARSFNLDENNVLLRYTESLLLPAKSPHHSESRDALPLKIQLQRVQEAIGKITLEDELIQKLIEILMKVDPYDYERLMFILDQAIRVSPSNDDFKTKYRLLEFLLAYKRVAPPSAQEINYRAPVDELDVGDVESRISPLSKTRLPFHPLLEDQSIVWKILTPELNNSTLHMWLPVAKSLRLHTDNIYLLAMKNIVNRHINMMKAQRSAVDQSSSSKPSSSSSSSSVSTPKSQCNWEETDTMYDTMNAIKEILFKLSSYRSAMSCISSIVKQLPMGSEKVLALKATVQVSKLWSESCAPESKEYKEAKSAHDLCQEHMRRLSTEQILFQNQLGEPHLLRLANKPNDLIMELYKHPSIQKRAGAVSKLCNLPDIHSATEKIAAIYNADLPGIRITLREQWLPSSQQSSLDMSVTMDSENMNMTLANQDSDEDEINLKRLIYLLQNDVAKSTITFLVRNIQASSENSQVNTMCKIRALRCLFNVVNPNKFQGVSETHEEKLKDIWVTLMYIHELERLGVSTSQKDFKTHSKEGLVRSIWQKYRHEKRAIRLVANLCLDFKILDGQLWNKILQQLLAFNMVEFLRHVLIRLAEFPELWSVPCLVKMWEAVLTVPLTAVSPPLSPAQEDECLQTLNLLHRCPCVLELNLIRFARLYMKLDLPVYALSCVLLLSKSKDRVGHADSLLSGEGINTVVEQLELYQSQAKLVPMLEQIETVVLDYVARHSLYDNLKGTSYETRLALSLVQQNAIEDIFMHLLENDRTSELIQLLSLFKQIQPKLDYARLVPTIQVDTEKFRLYAKLHGLEKKASEFLPPEPEPVPDKEDSELSINEGIPEYDSIMQ